MCERESACTSHKTHTHTYTQTHTRNYPPMWCITAAMASAARTEVSVAPVRMCCTRVRTGERVCVYVCVCVRVRVRVSVNERKRENVCVRVCISECADVLHEGSDWRKR